MRACVYWCGGAAEGLARRVADRMVRRDQAVVPRPEGKLVARWAPNAAGARTRGSGRTVQGSMLVTRGQGRYGFGKRGHLRRGRGGCRVMTGKSIQQGGGVLSLRYPHAVPLRVPWPPCNRNVSRHLPLL